MSIDTRSLYELLPAIYRARDAEQLQQPLKSLLEVFEEYRGALDENLHQLYEDAFIETCAEWAAFYIGDLIGYRPLHGITNRLGSPRAEVANTIRYRRRKGTASMLEQLARDVTGWNARVVEFFEWLGWNQYMQHTRVLPPRGGTADLRDHDACERVLHGAGAFDTLAHGVDVRRISNGVGRYNISNIGVFLWRLNPYSVRFADAREVAAGHYTFNAIGIDAPLFNSPQTEDEITHLAEEINVPGALRRRLLYDELEARRVSLAREESPGEVYFGAQPVFQITINEEPEPVLPEQIVICNLEDWHVPPDSKQYPRLDGTTFTQKIRAAVDPVLGRLTFPAAETIEQVAVSYTYAFSDSIGGGPYDRAESIATLTERPVDWQVLVSRDAAPIASQVVPTLKQAVAAWNQVEPGKFGVIAIGDSHTYEGGLTGNDTVLIPEGSRLLIIAASWPERVVGQFVPADIRPHLLGDLDVKGTAPMTSKIPGEFILNGILLEGSIGVPPGNLASLHVDHCTLVPDKALVSVESPSTTETSHLGSLTIAHSICGPVMLPQVVAKLTVSDSVLSNGMDNDRVTPAIDAAETEVNIERSTILGTVEADTFNGSDSIFTGPVRAARRQQGCVRFSYLPVNSRAPRRYRCQPDTETPSLVPSFTATRYGQPGFAQLRLSSPLQIRTGASDEAEMGAFHNLYQPQREINLRVRLEEYLRCNLEAGIFYVT